MWNKLKSSWFFWTVIFVFVSAGLFVLTMWNPLVGLVSILLLIASIFVGTILSAYMNPEPKAKKHMEGDVTESLYLPENQLENSKSLLRYATAILSFLSLITTAQGMKSFVFSETWMSYLGSFAVQSILIVFSLLLCRFYVQIMFLPWANFVKKLASTLLTLFFCVALVISSTFSFSFIANNAYANTSASDSDTTIRTYLINSAQKLQEENEKRGKQLLREIPATARERLEPAMKKAQSGEIEGYREEFQTVLEKIPTTTGVSAGAVDIEWSALANLYDTEIELLKSSYDGVYKRTYDDAAEQYNAILAKIEELKEGTAEASAKTMNDLLSQITAQKNSLQVTLDPQSGISAWRTSHFNNDIEPYRTTYRTSAERLLGLYGSLEESLSVAAEKLGMVTDVSGSNASEGLDEILRKIYLLGMDETVDVKDLTNQIADLAVQASANGGLDSEGILEIVELQDDLTAYQDYLDLKAGLQNFQNNNLRKVYQISQGEHQEVSEDSSYVIVTKDEWKSQRNKDFYIFLELLEHLPDVDIESDFNSAELVANTGVMQRDLLGELTDFERAFNYFKYDFKAMAFFSAFVAVFFDLGAFLTGCFLFCTEFFQTKKNHVS